MVNRLGRMGHQFPSEQVRVSSLVHHPDWHAQLEVPWRAEDNGPNLSVVNIRVSIPPMHIRCPHCRNPIEVVNDAELGEISCPSCGSSFSLTIGDTTESFRGQVRRIAHFELVRELGVGKFGSVWLAKDTQLDRTVAIKIPRKGALDAEETTLFLRDARASAQLKHPGIVSVHEVGRENDLLYIVSDYIEGANLKEWLTGVRLSFRESAELVVKIAEALHHAHESGVVHRDLKPGNVMLDRDGQPHVIDFGLAKRDAGEITMTMDGHVLGTPAYMSPEQAKGKGHDADRRSDVYSLGVILYELLTGELPFRGTTQMLLYQIQHEEPPRPRKLNAKVPRDLETIVLKCLEKDAGKRYSTAQSLAGDLRRWLVDKPIEARPVRQLERSLRWCKRNPLLAAMSGAVMLSLVMVAVMSSLAAVRVAEANRQAVLERDAARSALLREEARREQAERESRFSNAYRLAAQSKEVLNDFPQRSLLLALEALNLTLAHGEPRVAAAEQALRDGLRVIGGYQVLPTKANRDLVVCSPGGLWFLSTKSDADDASLWSVNAANLTVKEYRLPGSAGGLVDWEFSANSRWLVATDIEGTLRVWNLGNDKSILPPVTINQGTILPVRRLTVSNDGRWIFGGDADRQVCVIDMKAPAPVTPTRITVTQFDYGGCIVVSPDSRWLAIACRKDHDADLVFASSKFEITVWDLNRNNPFENPLHFPAGEGQHCEMAFTPDCSRLVAEASGTAYLWNLMTDNPAEKVLTFPPIDESRPLVSSVCISADGRWLITGHSGGLVLIRDLSASNLTSCTVLRGAEYGAMAVSSDSRWLVAGGNGSNASVWDLAAKDVSASRVRLIGHEDELTSVAISPDNQWIYTVGRGVQPRRWKLGSQDASTREIALRGPATIFRSVTVSDTGHAVAALTNDNSLRLWRTNAKAPEETMRELPSCPEKVIGPLSFRHNLVFTRTEKGNICLWDTGNERNSRPIVLLCGDGRAAVGDGVLDWEADVTADGHWMFTGDEKGTRLWNLQSPKSPPVMLGDDWWAANFSHDSRWLVTTRQHKPATLWDLSATDVLKSARPLMSRDEKTSLNLEDMSRDGRWLVTSFYERDGKDIESLFDFFSDATVPGDRRTKYAMVEKIGQVWDLTSTDPTTKPFRIQLSKGTSFEPFFSFVPDGKKLLGVGADRTARLWNLPCKDEADNALIFEGRDLDTASAGFENVLKFNTKVSQDGRWLAMEGEGTILLWDLTVTEIPKPAIKLDCPNPYVTQFAISPDSHWLAALTVVNANVSLFDLTADDPSASAILLRANDEDLHTIVFTPDSNRLITCASNVSRVWDLRLDEVMALAREIAGRDLTPAERNRHLVTRPGEKRSANSLERVQKGLFGESFDH